MSNEQSKKKSFKMPRKEVIIGLLAAVLIAIGALCYILIIQPVVKLKNVEKLLENGSYREALALFDYDKDNADIARAEAYIEAKHRYESGFSLDMGDMFLGAKGLADSDSYYTAIKTEEIAAAEHLSLVKFGSYEQDGNISNGAEPIEWRVLANTNGRVYLLANQSLAYKRANLSGNAASWRNSDLYKWLNEEFLPAAFTGSQRSMLAQLEDRGTVTLPTEAEIHKYLSYEYRNVRYSPVAEAEEKSVRNQNPYASISKRKYNAAYDFDGWWTLTNTWNIAGKPVFSFFYRWYSNYGVQTYTDPVKQELYLSVRPMICININESNSAAHLNEYRKKVVEHEYKTAMELLETKQYNKAANLFKSILNYENSEAMYSKAKAEAIVEGNVGDKVYFGSYEQDAISDNGKEPILWRIIDENKDFVMLISDKILGYRKFDTRKKSVKWNESELRTWLNTDFLESAFSKSEVECLASDDSDLVCVLSYEQFEQYKEITGENAINIRSLYRVQERKSNSGAYIDRYPSWWVTNTQASSGVMIIITNDPTINWYGPDPSQKCGVRPVIRISKKALERLMMQ